MNKRELTNAQLLIQQRMLQHLLFANLVGLDDKLAPGIREFNRATFALTKMFRADLSAVNEGDSEAVGQPGLRARRASLNPPLPVPRGERTKLPSWEG